MTHATHRTGTLQGLASLLVLAAFIFQTPALMAETKVKKAYVKNGKLVLEVVEEPQRSADVEVRLGNQTINVPVSGLVPNRTRSFTTQVDIPCGDHQLRATTSGSNSPYSTTLSHPCGGSGTPSGGSSSSSALVELFDLQVAPTNGLLGVRLKTQARLPRGPIEVEFSYAGYSEKARVNGLIPNRVARANSRQPFPCNETHRVRAKLATPGLGDRYVDQDITRSCSRNQGTPNLVPHDLKRQNNMRTTAYADSKVPIRLEVKNDSAYDMPFNNQGTPSFQIKVPGVAKIMVIRRQLQAGEKWSLPVDLTLSCYSNESDRFREVTMTVDAANNIRESDENDNKRTFTVEANRCRDAG